MPHSIRRERVADCGWAKQTVLWLAPLLGLAALFWDTVDSVRCRAEDKPAAKPSPLDRLDPGQIPTAERFDWQPKELVAVLGSHRGRHWGEMTTVAFGHSVFVGDSSGKKLHEWQLPGPTAIEGVGGVRFAPDGRHLVIENSNATAYILRLAP